jgi:hypothetical protein
MAPNELPYRPNLEQLRKRARDLLRAARDRDPAALGRFQAQLAGRRNRVQLAEALAVVARESGFPSWTRLKTYVENLGKAEVEVASVRADPIRPSRMGRGSRRRGPKQMPGIRYIQDLRAAVVDAARQGEPFPFIFGPPLGPLRAAVQGPLRQALVRSGDLPLVVNVLLRGAEHPNPRIRAECAHAMDWLADERCLPSLLRLVNDSVPRVRWFAIHSLACDDCKLSPLPDCPEVVPLLVSKASADPRTRVRRQAQETLRRFSAVHDASVGQPCPG